MLTKDDLKGIEGLLKPIKKTLDSHSKKFEDVEEKLAINTVSVVKIENKIDAALELRKDVREVREEVKNHEERITHLESI